MTLPALIRPMLAVAGDALPADAGWSYEFKWDGVRAVVYLEHGQARVLSRNDRDVSVSYPELAEVAAALDRRALVLDGEIVALGAGGAPSFSALQSRMHVTDPAAVRRARARTPVCYLAFDLLHDGDRSLLDEPYERRRAALAEVGLDAPHAQVPPAFAGDGAAVLAASRERRLEGVLAKRLGSRYQPGRRSEDWLKVKHAHHQEVVIVGVKPGQGRRAGTIGSLLLAVPDASGDLRYAGHVGTGFSATALAGLEAALASLTIPTSPTRDEVPRAHARDARWVAPVLVGEVAFTEWTPDGRLRHPSWRGLRPDKEPGQVRREP